MKKILFSALVFNITLGLNALEFGSMGNTPASVGGAGVAYKKNSWAVYYNPALLGANRKSNIAYSFGVGYGDKNLAELTSIDFKNIQNFPDKINAMVDPTTTFNLHNTSSISAKTSGFINQNPLALGSGMQMAVARGGADYTGFGLLSDVLGKVGGGNGIKDEDSLTDYLNGVLCNVSPCPNQTLDEAIKKLTELTNDERNNKFTQIKDDIQEAIKEVEKDGGDVGLLGSIIDNIDVDKIDKLIEGFKNGANGSDFDLGKFLDDLGGIKITRGYDSLIDKFLDDYKKINNTINSNGMKISSNNGFVFHIGGNDDRGAIGIGLLASANGYFNIGLDKNRRDIIMKNGDKFFEALIKGDSITISYLGSLGGNTNGDKQYTEEQYKNNSILSPDAQHNLIANSVVLAEVPISYGHTIPLFAGDLHLGVSLKYIHALSLNASQIFNFDNFNFNFDLVDNMKQTSTFGVDLGMLYTIEGFSVGVVGKNLNVPKIKTSNGSFRLNPQFRAGVGFEVWRFTFLADIDLYPNDTLEIGKKNQMVGGGVIFDATWLDFRFGIMGDMWKNPYGVIFTAGMNILHFLDISVQTSTKLVNIKNNLKMPNYFDLRIGGRFLF
ncbi:MAG: conjugal transfer protein TraF [Helicobacteraceae bacterium]|nr:conjugal transfer protein TraF [Helicobacteraceae bacterium]